MDDGTTVTAPSSGPDGYTNTIDAFALIVGESDRLLLTLNRYTSFLDSESGGKYITDDHTMDQPDDSTS